VLEKLTLAVTIIEITISPGKGKRGQTREGSTFWKVIPAAEFANISTITIIA
jgi:hypothetical protein